jgi:hypothetical protein
MRERATLLGGSIDAGSATAPSASARPDPLRTPRRLIPLLIADDDLMRAGLIELLTADPQIDIVGEAATGAMPSNRRVSSCPMSC